MVTKLMIRMPDWAPNLLGWAVCVALRCRDWKPSLQHTQRRDPLATDGGRQANRGRLIAVVRVAMLVCAVGAFARPAAAACSGSSPTRTAASASAADVNDCVSAAASGDTIRVPTGTATWSGVTLPANKDLSVIGAGIGNTRLTCSGGVCININMGASHRVSGFTMTGGPGIATSRNSNQNLNKHFRIDHNRIVSTSGWEPMELTGGDNAVHPQGLVDNNEFVDVSIHANGTNFQLDEADYQHVIWTQRTPLGDSTAIVYIEANLFQHTSANVNSSDGNYAGRYVFRFNTTTSGRQTSEIHSVQGDNRAMQRWEVYHNTASNPSGFSGIAFIRGGSGVAFGNRLNGSGWSFDILMDNVRSEESVSTSGRCNGSSNWDGNTAGMSGYPCRDQIGRSQDTAQWAPGRPYAQVFQPVYFWNNLINGSEFDIDNSGLNTWIRQDRDWYTTNAAFNGTAGVGSGPIASRPSTCTTGVAYWATNEGEWNSLQAGPDGRLYKCTATNTWSLYYTPYPYPHPWQGTGTPPEAPGPPSNLRITTTSALLWLLPATLGLCLLGRRRTGGD